MKKIIYLIILILMVMLSGCTSTHEHQWKDATCTEPKTCEVCGETEGEPLGHLWCDATCTEPVTCERCGLEAGQALGHDWTNATCTEPKTCKRCGLTEGEPLGHLWREATCTEPKTCERCGLTEGEPLGHQWRDNSCIEPATFERCGLEAGQALGHDWCDATCTEPKTCKRCGVTEGESLGHLWHDATCIEPKTCERCGATEGEPLGHLWRDATCTEPKTCERCGLTEGEPLGHQWRDAICITPATCSRCGLKAGQALGHDWCDATCTEPKTCERCGVTEGEPLGHQWRDATCTEPKTCVRCGLTEDEPLGHQWRDATCTEAKSCERCGLTEGEPLGHQWHDATCTTPATCSRCGLEEGQLLGHQWRDATCTEAKTCERCSVTEGEPLGHNWKNATCTEPKTCERCHVTEGEPLGHEWRDATCTEAKTCERCGLTEGEPLGHDWCDATYSNPKTCNRCGLTEGTVLGQYVDGYTLVNLGYSRNKSIIADVVMGRDYEIDNTGTEDVTRIIQNAIDDLYNKQYGGTIYFPKGTYKVSSVIYVRDNIVLEGEWADPDTMTDDDYGTVFLAEHGRYYSGISHHEASLFYLTSNSGIEGCTIYYPKQTPTNPIDYGFCIYVGKSETATISDITIINANRGIGVDTDLEGHANILINRIRICALFKGLRMDASYDVGYINDVKVSPVYWLEAKKDWAYANKDELIDYMQNNCTAYTFGDLDADMFTSLYADHCKCGMWFTTKARSTGFWGSFTDVNLTSCTMGIKIDTMMTGNSVIISQGIIEGSEYAILNNMADNPIKLADVTIKGAISGLVIEETEDLDSYNFTDSARPQVNNYLYVADLSAYDKTKVDCSDELQEVLNKAALTGGIVYVPNGVYSLYKTITIPTGVELRGCSSILQKPHQLVKLYASLLLSYVDDGAGFILKEGSGISGFRIWNPIFDPLSTIDYLDNNDSRCDSQVCIKTAGNNCFIENMVINASMTGVDFSGCDNHYISRVYGFCYKTLVKAGGENGLMKECFSNCTLIIRHSSLFSYFNKAYTNNPAWGEFQNNYNNTTGYQYLREHLYTKYCIPFVLDNATNEQIRNIFMFCPRTLLKTISSSAVIFNTCADVLADDCPMFDFTDSDITIINCIRVFGQSLSNSNSDVQIYNRNERFHAYEEPYDSNSSVIDYGESLDENKITEKIYVSHCEEGNYATSSNYSEGEASWAIENLKTNAFSYSFEAIDLSKYDIENLYFHISIYTESIDDSGMSQLEITSSGQADLEEGSIPFTAYLKKLGWNDVYVPLQYLTHTNGTIDLSNINFLRLYVVEGADSFYIDDIYFAVVE